MMYLTSIAQFQLLPGGSEPAKCYSDIVNQMTQHNVNYKPNVIRAARTVCFESERKER